MRIANAHIGYCLNIYPGESAAAVCNHITRECPRVKAAVSPDADMGIGLWLAAKAAKAFRSDPQRLRRLLADQHLYAFTVNAFPFGDFHARPVKANVYRPDWSSTERLAYTADVADILSQLLPEGVDGSISTVPVAYGKACPPRALENLLAAAVALEKVERRTGKRIRLALEPEPDCFLERVEECIGFFDRLRRQDPALVDRYLGICLDVCHSALQFEDPCAVLRRLKQAGICVPKVQISAALEVEDPTDADLAYLKAFDDGIYFHQTRVRAESAPLLRFSDLPDALAHRPAGHWRVHFHVPLHFEAPETKVHSTAALLNGEFFKQVLQSTTHLETETYTFAVLPEKDQDAGTSVGHELAFVLKAVLSAAEAIEQTPP